jgi:hypothetical protein
MLMNSGTIVLIHGARAAYLPSEQYCLYLDSNGDAPHSNASGFLGSHTRPLYLSRARVEKLHALYLANQVTREVVRRRSTAERIIKSNWY